MKKFFNLFCGVAALALTATSCSQEEPAMPSPDADGIPAVQTPGEVTPVTISSNVPAGIRSRATGENLGISDMTHLYCGIYDTNNKVMLSQELTAEQIASEATADGKINLTFKVATENHYKVFIWVDNAAASTKHVDIASHTATIETGSKNRDFAAFCSEIVEVYAAKQTNYAVTLRRPYAEVALVSNMTENPLFQNIYTDGAPFTMFGKNGDNIVDTDFAMPIVLLPSKWDYLTDEIDWADNTELTALSDTQNWPVLVEGCRTLMVRNVLIGRTSRTFDGRLNFLKTANVNTTSYLKVDVPSMAYRANRRYVLVDKVDNSGGGSGDEGGGIFFDQVKFDVIVDVNLDGSDQVDL